LVAHAVTLEALRFFDIQKNLAAPIRIPRASQRSAGKPFMVPRGTLAAESQVEFGRRSRRLYCSPQPITPLGESRCEALGVNPKGPVLVAPVERLTI
jgi:hypothetical protein